MKNNEPYGCGCWFYILGALLLLGMSFGLAYLIVTSDLPDWMKFWLLRG